MPSTDDPRPALFASVVGRLVGRLEAHTLLTRLVANCSLGPAQLEAYHARGRVSLCKGLSCDFCGADHALPALRVDLAITPSFL